MNTKKHRRRVLTALVSTALIAGLTASCAPGSKSEDAPPGSEPAAPVEPSDGAAQDGGAGDFSNITAPVTPKDVAAYGDITLSVWADAGEETVLEKLVPLFEEQYPNVTVEVTYKGWDDLMETVINALDSNNPPDVANSNQGFAMMGIEVKAGLIRPMDDFRAAYGMSEGLPESGWETMTWNPDGSEWGSGTLYAIGGATQPQGLFYNRAKLEELGLEPPESIGDLDAALKAASEAGELPIMLGNTDQYPLGSHVFGIVNDMYADPAAINAWLAGAEGATFDTPGTREALTKLKEWGESGYFGEGYNGRSLDDAVAAYAKGEGVFFLGGSFNGAKISAESPDGFGYALLKATSGDYATTGTLGTPWTISSKSKVPGAAIAFLGMLTSKDFAQVYADEGRLPVADLGGVTPTGSLQESMLVAAHQLFEGGDFIGFLDWASPTMQRELGTNAQELLAGQIDVDTFVANVQGNWEEFQEERKE
ncbi:MAG: extracellular solute-binding protein [Bifidobacteriaceae bacterium]|nr:extracellular solute-binding protein [Bifidobacteriaceae bacterium]